MPKSQGAIDDTANRRAQLQKWIDTHFGGKQASFVAANHLNQGEISALLSSKSFGSVRARNLETACGMPTRYLESRPDETASEDGPPPLSARALLFARAFDDEANEEKKKRAESAVWNILKNPAAKRRAPPAPIQTDVKAKRAAKPRPVPVSDR